MALVRVYCGLASAEQAAQGRDDAWLTAAVVDDAGRLLDVCEVSDDPAGYARLSTVLAERSGGPTAVAIAADGDDHRLTMLLTAAGRSLAIADDDAVDDYAERFADDESADEMESPPAERRAVGLARALQAGALSAISLPAPRDLAGLKGILVAHAALITGRHSAAVALREVLRELHPAALRAYPDPAEPVPLAVLDALPEPQNRAVTDEIIAELTDAGVADSATVKEAVTALRVAIAETPRRGVVNKTLNAAVAETIRQAVAAVRACDAACDALVTTLTERVATPAPPAPPAPPRTRAARRAAAEADPADAPSTGRHGASTSRVRPQPTPASAPASPQPLNAPPIAPPPVAPPTSRPLAPAASAAVPVPPPPPTVAPVSPPAWVTGTGSNRPVSVPPPPPPGMTPMVPNQRGSLPPAEAGEPFRPTLTNAAVNSARAARAAIEGQRGQSDRKPEQRREFGLQNAAWGSRRAEETSPVLEEPAARYSATDYAVPVPTPRPDAPPPGSRANWPLAAPGDDGTGDLAAPFGEQDRPAFGGQDRLPFGGQDRPAGGRTAQIDLSSSGRAEPPDSTGALAGGGRVTPPWQADDLPPEPPTLRLVEPPPLADRALRDDLTGELAPVGAGSPAGLPEPPPLRLVESEANGRRGRRAAVETAAPIAEEGDGDLLIFSETRSAWFVGHGEDEPDWESIADFGWRAAEQAARPAVGAQTAAGLPKRVPQQNLVPGSAISAPDEPLRIVRDAASIAAHTSGYFSGWRRGQEINGYAVGGRPGRQSAVGWDFSRDGGRDDDEEEYGYRSAR